MKASREILERGTIAQAAILLSLITRTNSRAALASDSSRSARGNILSWGRRIGCIDLTCFCSSLVSRPPTMPRVFPCAIDEAGDQVGYRRIGFRCIMVCIQIAGRDTCQFAANVHHADVAIFYLLSNCIMY